MILWSVLVFFIIFITSLDVFTSILLICGLIDQSIFLVNFSILKTVSSIFKTKPTSSFDPRRKFQDPSILFNGIRVIIHVILIAGHFSILPYGFYTDEIFNLSQIEKYLTSVMNRSALFVFFLFNGIASGKWYFKQVKNKNENSKLKLYLKFVLERVLLIAPVHFMLVIFYTYYVNNFLTNTHDELAINACNEAFVPNMLFLGNFASSTAPVSF